MIYDDYVNQLSAFFRPVIYPYVSPLDSQIIMGIVDVIYNNMNIR